MPVIKKYENRRLYDTAASRYVNLDDIARMVTDGEDISVVDVKTGRDLTREILLQIVHEAPGGAEVFPAALLRRVIRASGPDPLPRMRREQLVIGFDLLDAQLEQSEAYLDRLYEPLRTPPPLTVSDLPPATYDTWSGGRTGPRESDELPAREAASALDAHGREEMDELRAQLARLEERLKR
ncbi:MAG: polyhydroxyalkanoate synthesis regulator DNA-binding domain-containing protein [Pseudomonadota bacterium]|nr:polyhydroxyalkanoate synthesis regulator DNA-binding domain-containing protein [Pseudomonadota bacterium]